MSFYSWMVTDRKWEKQERGWRASGNCPPVVVRTYDDDDLYQRDAGRLVGLGYEIVSQSVQNRLLGYLTPHTKVTYQRAGNKGSVTP